MAKLTLNPDPTFTAKVVVSVPGGTADVQFTFRYRDKDELAAWLKAAKKAKDWDNIMEMATGWDLDDEFNLDNAKRLCTKYPAAGVDIVEQYVGHLMGHRLGN